MKLRTLALCHLLSKGNFKYTVLQENARAEVDTVRAFDGDLNVENAMIIIRGEDIAKMARLNGNSNVILWFREGKKPESMENKRYIKSATISIESGSPEKLLNYLYKQTASLNRWEMQLDLLSEKSRNYQDLIDCSDPITSEALSLIDKDFAYVAYSIEKSKTNGYLEKMVNNGRVTDETVSQLISTPGFEKIDKIKSVFEFEDDYVFIARNIFYNKKYVGRLLMMASDDSVLNEYNKMVLGVVANYVEKMYSKEGSFYLSRETSGKLEEYMKASLEGKSINQNFWEQALGEKGWKISDGFRLMIFDVAYRREKKVHAGYLCPQIENMWKFAVGVEIKEWVVVLLNQRLLEKSFEQSLAYFVRNSLLVAGISNRFDDFSKMTDYMAQARAAIDIGIWKDPHLWYYYFSDYVLDYIKNRVTEQISPESLEHPALKKLKEYDDKNNSDYYESLKYFIKTKFNMTAAADLAFVHRTTFIKRIEKVVELTDLDLDDWDTRMLLMLSYSLMDEK